MLKTNINYIQLKTVLIYEQSFTFAFQIWFFILVLHKTSTKKTHMHRYQQKLLSNITGIFGQRSCDHLYTLQMMTTCLWKRAASGTDIGLV